MKKAKQLDLFANYKPADFQGHKSSVFQNKKARTKANEVMSKKSIHTFAPKDNQSTFRSPLANHEPVKDKAHFYNGQHATNPALERKMHIKRIGIER